MYEPCACVHGEIRMHVVPWPALNSSLPQEIIQNADDAGARTVKFFLDHRQHGTESVVKRDLAKHQGPALLAYNDAQFTEKDWEGIQNLQRSCKKEDPFKVGKFGIGFNSVYHVTGKGRPVASSLKLVRSGSGCGY